MLMKNNDSSDGVETSYTLFLHNRIELILRIGPCIQKNCFPQEVVFPVESPLSQLEACFHLICEDGMFVYVYAANKMVE